MKIAEAMLEIWPHLENYCKGLDRQIYKKAMSSYTNPNATMRIIENIIDLVTRKDILQTLLHEMETNVDGLPAQEREILRRFYFTTEEKYLGQVNYPDFEAHKKEHEAFVSEVVKQLKSFEENQNDPVALVDFLKNWLLNHIAVMDKKYAPYLAGL
jgi:hemerythrin-like metal-binding protein